MKNLPTIKFGKKNYIQHTFMKNITKATPNKKFGIK